MKNIREINQINKLRNFSVKLLIELVFLYDDNNIIKEKNPYFMKVFNCSEVTVQRAMKELKDKKYINIVFEYIGREIKNRSIYLLKYR